MIGLGLRSDTKAQSETPQHSTSFFENYITLPFEGRGRNFNCIESLSFSSTLLIYHNSFVATMRKDMSLTPLHFALLSVGPHETWASLDTSIGFARI